MTRSVADDEFDTIGLGELRSMTDYESEGPVRLRALPEDVPKVESKGGLPVWLVVLVIVAAVAGGVLVSSLR